MYQGFLKVILDVADGAAPVSGESVYVKTTGFTNDGKITAISDFPVDSSRYNYKLTTDSSGATQSVSIEAPDPALRGQLHQLHTAVVAGPAGVRAGGRLLFAGHRLLCQALPL